MNGPDALSTAVLEVWSTVQLIWKCCRNHGLFRHSLGGTSFVMGDRAMKRSPLNAVFRIFDAGGESVSVYYVDKILNELLFVGVWRPRRAPALAERFARTFGFDDYELEIVMVGAKPAA